MTFSLLIEIVRKNGKCHGLFHLFNDFELKKSMISFIYLMILKLKRGWHFSFLSVRFTALFKINYIYMQCLAKRSIATRGTSDEPKR